MRTNKMPLVGFPADGIVRLFLIWVLIGAILRVSLDAQPKPTLDQDPSRAVGRFLMDWIGPYTFGALWSGIQFIHISAIGCVGLFVFSMVTPRLKWKGLAQATVGFLSCLSLFTLWVEPWTKTLTSAANIFMIVVGMFSVIPEIVATIVWCLAWAFLVDREFPDPTG